MPSLKRLLEELKRLRVDPDDVRVSGRVYDCLVEQGEELVEGDLDEED